MFTFSINKVELDSRIDSLDSWDDWYLIEEEIFKLEQWPELSVDDIENDICRGDIEIEGVLWHATTNNYDVHPLIIYLYEASRLRVFEKLDPISFQHNMAAIQEYGKLCVSCKRWAAKYEIDRCPICNDALVIYRLPED